MDYNQINGFLENFKKLLFKSENSQRTIVEIVSRHIMAQITTKEVKIKGSVIFINASPLVRNEIFIHKQGILKDLKDQITDTNFTDIR